METSGTSVLVEVESVESSNDLGLLLLLLLLTIGERRTEGRIHTDFVVHSGIFQSKRELNN